VSWAGRWKKVFDRSVSRVAQAFLDKLSGHNWELYLPTAKAILYWTDDIENALSRSRPVIRLFPRLSSEHNKFARLGQMFSGPGERRSAFPIEVGVGSHL